MRLHWWIGWIALVVFLLTGQYMRYVHEPPVEELEMGLRLLFRSRHIYLLFAALLNLAVASGAAKGRPRWLRLLGSTLLALSPAVLLAAFVVESVYLRTTTPLSIYGVQAAFAGALCLVVAGWWARKRGAGHLGPSPPRSRAKPT